MRIILHIWRQQNARRPGPHGALRSAQRERAHVVPRDARRAQRGPDRQGRRADGVRPRLPRGHLRHVRLHGERRGARPAARHHALPAPHAPFQGRRRAVPRAVARRAFPVVKDLVVDRSAFDRIIAAGGFISVSTGSAPDGNAILVPKESADRAMDAAACIGCGACVAMCPNASASLFMGAKIAHLGLLPQGQPERDRRVVAMVAQANRGAVRKLHQHRRMRSRLPQGDQAGSDRPNEPRFPPRQLERPRAPARGCRGGRQGAQGGRKKVRSGGQVAATDPLPSLHVGFS